MIKYIGTRSLKNKKIPFSQAILKTIDENGGLYVPTTIPHLSKKEIKKLLPLSYQELTYYVFKLFDVDFEEKELKNLINQAYADNFDTKEVINLSQLDENTYLNELWHGPTASFKDLALQIKPLIFSKALEKNKEKWNYLILVATSGDTGAAALSGYKDKKNIKIIVLFPKNGVSSIQRLSMTTFEGKNLSSFEVEGNFDEIQKIVKNIFNDLQFNQFLKEKYKTILSSANSINLGRLIPQIVYHLKAYFNLVKLKKINFGDKVDYVIPTGNFGNILASFYAKKMGLPINKLILANNINNSLTFAFKNGLYQTKENILKTISPSIDIVVASNFERLLFHLNPNPNTIKKMMSKFLKTKTLKLPKKIFQKIKTLFYANYSTEEETKKTIKECFFKKKILIDPHTAVALNVYQKYKKEFLPKVPAIIASTAAWYKFPQAVYQAIFEKEEKDDFKIINFFKNKIKDLKINQEILNLPKKPIRFKKVLPKNEEKIKEEIINFLNTF